MRPTSIVFLLVVVSGEIAAAQTPRGLIPSPAPSIDRAVELHYRMRPRDAMDTLEAAVERHPSHEGALVAAAREALNVGILSSQEDESERWYRRSEDYARGALEVDSASLEARYWLAAALGRRALMESRRSRVRMAEEIRTLADQVLAADSAHPGAHHVLGMWHAEIRGLRSVTRFFAEHLLGADEFDDASWAAAIEHLQRAVRLEPEMLLFRMDLARVYAERGRREEARAQLREVLDRPTIHPIDPRIKQEAQELLKDLQ